MGMDHLVIKVILPLEGPDLFQKSRQGIKQIVHGRFGVTARQMNRPSVGADLFNPARRFLMAPGENIHRNALGAQSGGQLADVDVHPPGFALSGRRQGTRVKADECGPFDIQIRVTTICWMTCCLPPK